MLENGGSRRLLVASGLPVRAPNAPAFGFVLGYPAGKEPTSGYVYEPWHIRYVGLPLAAALSTTIRSDHRDN